MALETNVQQYSASRIDYQQICYLSSNKVVSIANEGGYITLKVGTISGNSISWGSSNTFHSPYYLTGKPSIISTSETTIVFVYTDNNDDNYFYIVAGTISGNTITFGTPSKVDSDIYIPNAYYNKTMIRKLDTNKFVVFYYNPNGGASYTKVGTVSGTTISLGNKVNVGYVRDASPSNFYDIVVFNSSKFVCVICNNSTGTLGATLYLGTISSGTTHSYSSPKLLTSDFGSGDSQGKGKRISDSKIMFCYYNDRSKAVTYSGTSLSVGSENSITKLNYSPRTSLSFDFDIISESSIAFLGYGYSLGSDKITASLCSINSDVISGEENSYLQNKYSSWNIKNVIKLTDKLFIGLFDNNEITYTVIGTIKTISSSNFFLFFN